MKTVSEFSKIIRDKYPGEYDGVDDHTLASTIVQKYPYYKDKVYIGQDTETLKSKFGDMNPEQLANVRAQELQETTKPTQTQYSPVIGGVQKAIDDIYAGKQSGTTFQPAKYSDAEKSFKVDSPEVHNEVKNAYTAYLKEKYPQVPTGRLMDFAFKKENQDKYLEIKNSIYDKYAGQYTQASYPEMVAKRAVGLAGNAVKGVLNAPGQIISAAGSVNRAIDEQGLGGAATSAAKGIGSAIASVPGAVAQSVNERGILGTAGEAANKIGQYAYENPLDAAGIGAAAKAAPKIIAGAAKAVPTAGKAILAGAKQAPAAFENALDTIVPGVSVATNVAKSAGTFLKGQRERAMSFGKSVLPSLSVPDKEKVSSLVGKVIQGEEKDIKPALMALQSIDTKDVRSYKDLIDKLGSRESDIIKLQDEYLKNNPVKVDMSNTVKEVGAGDTKVSINYVDKALKGLEELYTKSDDIEKLSSLKQSIKKFEAGDFTTKDLNDLARTWGYEKKGFSPKTGEPLTSLSSEQYENLRKGLKSTLRDFYPDEVLKGLDSKYSSISNTKRLLSKVQKRLNQLKQKVKDRTLSEKIGRLGYTIVDKLSAGIIPGVARGIAQKIVPSNVGLKTMNALDLEEGLKGLLKQIDDTNSKIKTSGEKEIKKVIEKQFKELTSGFISKKN